MSNIMFIEDLFIVALDTMDQQRLSMQYQDQSAARSFYTTITHGKDLTEKQGQYVLKILYKYRKSLAPWIDIEKQIEFPRWKKPFRVIDNQKKVWVEQDNKTPFVCLKFPYSLKDSYEKEFTLPGQKFDIWNPDRKIRMMYFYKAPLMSVLLWCNENDFEVDASFTDAIDQLNDITDNKNSYIPTSKIVNKQVELCNAPQSSVEYFKTKKTDNVMSDLILAKCMGYCYSGKVTNKIETIASSKTNVFYENSIIDLLEFTSHIDGKMVIMLDGNDEPLNFLNKLNLAIDKLGMDKNLFRVCFRANKNDTSNLNNWVKDNGFGGKIDGAKYLIFQKRPAKWLFKDGFDATIVITNNIIQTSQTTTRLLLERSPIVLYVGDFDPTLMRKNIVEL